MLFFRSKSPGYAQSQSVTSVGIVEAVTDSHSLEELVRLTAWRSVYSASQLEGFGASRSNPNKVIDFLLIGHLDPSMLLADLKRYNQDHECEHHFDGGREATGGPLLSSKIVPIVTAQGLSAAIPPRFLIEGTIAKRRVGGRLCVLETTARANPD
jgi:hypothetical protein